MQMTTVMNGLVIGKISGLGTRAALRVGVIGAAVGGKSEQTAMIMSLLFARREKALQIPLFARPGGQPDDTTEEPGPVDGNKGLEDKIDAAAKISEKAAAEVKAHSATLSETAIKVEKIATQLGLKDNGPKTKVASPSQGKAVAKKSGP